MKKMALACLMLLVTATALEAQKAPKKFKIEKKKCVRVWISDPGELYSTYDISEEEADQIRSEKVSESLMNQILDNHTEDAFPEGLQQLDSRIDHPDLMKAFHVYKVCKFGTRYVLVVPAQHNKHQPEGWAPDRTFFLIIGDTGVSEKE